MEEHYTSLDWFCFMTALVSLLPPLVGAIKAWWAGQLGAGARRPEPTVVALLANACGLLFGCTERQLEPFLLNLVGGLIRLLALVVFAQLQFYGQAVEALCAPLTLAFVSYYPMVVVVGVAHIQPELLYRCLCTLPGLLNAAAPLLSYHFMQENPTIDMLPHWVILLGYSLHGSAWALRGWTREDYYMLAQNAAGGFCSLLLLMHLHCNTPRREEDGHGLQEWLLDPRRPRGDAAAPAP